MVNRKEAEPQFVISAPVPGGNLVSTPRLSAPACQGTLLGGVSVPYPDPTGSVDPNHGIFIF